MIGVSQILYKPALGWRKRRKFFMMDDKIKDIFQRYGRTVTGYDYALVHATAEAVSSKHTWQGLTDDEMLLCNVEKNGEISSRENAMKNVEAKLKEKNT